MGELQDGQFEFIIDIAGKIREAIAPCLNRQSSKQSSNVAFSGDVTFQIDVVAEQALYDAVKNSTRSLAFFSEDKGLVKPNSEPEWLLVVDPIDGTRPIMCSFEMGVVSIALCKYSESAKFGDIEAGVVLAIKSGDLFYAERGRGLKVNTSNGSGVQLTKTKDVREMFWSFDTVGRPTRWVMKYLGELIDASGMQAGAFLFNNSAHSLTKIITGQLDAYIDVGGRILQDHPESESEFRAIGCGRVMGTFPYDIAAAYLILNEANCVITDAYGKSLEKFPLLAHGKEAVLSCVAASNEELHTNILQTFPELN